MTAPPTASIFGPYLTSVAIRLLLLLPLFMLLVFLHGMADAQGVSVGRAMPQGVLWIAMFAGGYACWTVWLSSTIATEIFREQVRTPPTSLNAITIIVLGAATMWVIVFVTRGSAYSNAIFDLYLIFSLIANYVPIDAADNGAFLFLLTAGLVYFQLTVGTAQFHQSPFLAFFLLHFLWRRFRRRATEQGLPSTV